MTKLGLLATCLALVAFAARAGEATEAGEVGLGRAEIGARGYIVLADGTTWLGKVVRAKPGVVAVRLETDEILFAKEAEVRGLLDTTAPYGSLGPGPRPSFTVLRDGRVFRGEVLERSADGLTIRLGPGALRSFPGSEVARVLRATERSRITDGADRHLTAPSAVLPPAGGVRVALVEGSDFSATVGVLDHASVTAGTSLPLLHADQFGANVFGSARAGLALGQVLHLAAGLHLRAGAAGSAEGFLSATATAAWPRFQVTLHAGPMFEGANGLGRFGAIGVALAGTLQVARTVDLVGEVWGSRLDGEWRRFTVGGVRWRVWRMALDLGIATATGRDPRPWLGLQLDATR